MQVNTHKDNWLCSFSSATGSEAAGSSWGQGIQYWDGFPVAKVHSSLSVEYTAVKQPENLTTALENGWLWSQDNSIAIEMHWVDESIRFWCSQAGKGRPKHASVPCWQFAMITDERRNTEYERAISKAIQKHSMCQAKSNNVHVLDLGAGSGLRSMFAARQEAQSCNSKCSEQNFTSCADHELKVICRAGAAQVTAIESSPHMCETAVEAISQNGFTSTCTVINADVRKLQSIKDTAKHGLEMQGKADICVFEVLKRLPSGCITCQCVSAAFLSKNLKAVLSRHLMLVCWAKASCTCSTTQSSTCCSLQLHWWGPPA